MVSVQKSKDGGILIEIPKSEIERKGLTKSHGCSFSPADLNINNVKFGLQVYLKAPEAKREHIKEKQQLKI